MVASMDAVNLPTPQWVREAVKAKGTTLARLCRKADMDPATFYRWEAGKGTPTMGTIQRLLTALDELLQKETK
jgi:transcriptional regulator with XRE-family HTH domain